MHEIDGDFSVFLYKEQACCMKTILYKIVHTKHSDWKGRNAMSLIIRPVEPKDKNRLAELMYQYIVDFYKRPKPPIEKIHSLIEMLLEQSKGIQYIAEQEGELLGFATLYFSFSTTKADKITIMNDLFVAEKVRGTGVAQKLFKACETFTKENEYAYMSWVTASDNKRAQRFYEKMGGSLENWLNYSI